MSNNNNNVLLRSWKGSGNTDEDPIRVDGENQAPMMMAGNWLGARSVRDLQQEEALEQSMMSVASSSASAMDSSRVYLSRQELVALTHQVVNQGGHLNNHPSSTKNGGTLMSSLLDQASNHKPVEILSDNDEADTENNHHRLSLSSFQSASTKSSTAANRQYFWQQCMEPEQVEEKENAQCRTSTSSRLSLLSDNSSTPTGGGAGRPSFESRRSSIGTSSSSVGENNTTKPRASLVTDETQDKKRESTISTASSTFEQNRRMVEERAAESLNTSAVSSRSAKTTTTTTLLPASQPVGWMGAAGVRRYNSGTKVVTASNDDNYEAAYALWRRKGMMREGTRSNVASPRLRVSQRVQKLQRPLESDTNHNTSVRSEGPVVSASASSRRPVTLSNVSTTFAESKSSGSDKSKGAGGGKKKNFASVLQKWKDHSDNKPCSHFLSPDSTGEFFSPEKKATATTKPASSPPRTSSHPHQPSDPPAHRLVEPPSVEKKPVAQQTKSVQEALNKPVTTRVVADTNRGRQSTKERSVETARRPESPPLKPKSPTTQAFKLKAYMDMKRSTASQQSEEPKERRPRAKSQPPRPDRRRRAKSDAGVSSHHEIFARRCKSPPKSRGDFKDVVQTVLVEQVLDNSPPGEDRRSSMPGHNRRFSTASTLTHGSGRYSSNPRARSLSMSGNELQHQLPRVKDLVLTSSDQEMNLRSDNKTSGLHNRRLSSSSFRSSSPTLSVKDLLTKDEPARPPAGVDDSFASSAATSVGAYASRQSHHPLVKHLVMPATYRRQEETNDWSNNSASYMSGQEARDDSAAGLHSFHTQSSHQSEEDSKFAAVSFAATGERIRRSLDGGLEGRALYQPTAFTLANAAGNRSRQSPSVDPPGESTRPSSKQGGWVNTMREASKVVEKDGMTWNPETGWTKLDKQPLPTEVLGTEALSPTQQQPWKADQEKALRRETTGRSRMDEQGSSPFRRRTLGSGFASDDNLLGTDIPREVFALPEDDVYGQATGRVVDSSPHEREADSPWTQQLVRTLSQMEEEHSPQITPREEAFSERPWQRDMMVRRVHSFAEVSNQESTVECCRCSNSVFSGNDEVTEFFLPLMGMACTCGKRPATLNKPEDPTALENILRPWQVEFLATYGIYRGEQLVKAHHRSAKALGKALRQYRRKEGMAPFRTRSCIMALDIYAKTAKAYVRSIRKQEESGVSELRLPNTLYIVSSFLEKMTAEYNASPRGSCASSP